jgi:hypothetical protein
MLTKIAYIYALIDPNSHLVRYIGKSVNPKSRLRSHISETKIYNHYRSRWIKSLLKKNQIPIMKILKICALTDFEKYEAEYINLYKSRKLTNSDNSGKGNIGRRKSIINKSITKISKKVYQYDLDGNFIEEFKSVRFASRKLKINHSYIVRCCKNEYKHTFGYIFSYIKGGILPVTNPNALKKKIIEIDNNGIIINEWKSLMDCSRETLIDNGNLSKVCNNILPKIKGRIFQFK